MLDPSLLLFSGLLLTLETALNSVGAVTDEPDVVKDETSGLASELGVEIGCD